MSIPIDKRTLPAESFRAFLHHDLTSHHFVSEAILVISIQATTIIILPFLKTQLSDFEQLALFPLIIICPGSRDM